MFKPGGLFGPKPGKAALDQAMGGSAPAPAGGTGGGSSRDDKKGGDDKGYGGSGFDPRGLERAAKAAKVCVRGAESLFLHGGLQAPSLFLKRFGCAEAPSTSAVRASSLLESIFPGAGETKPLGAGVQPP